MKIRSNSVNLSGSVSCFLVTDMSPHSKFASFKFAPARKSNTEVQVQPFYFRICDAAKHQCFLACFRPFRSLSELQILNETRSGMKTFVTLKTDVFRCFPTRNVLLTFVAVFVTDGPCVLIGS